jgi:hypothetical protein
VPIDPNQLPQDADTLRKIVLDLAAQLDRAFAEQHKYENLLRELLEAQRNRKSEQLSKEQLALFEVAWQARNPEDESADDEDDFGSNAPGGQKSEQTPNRKRGGRQPLARHLIRERIVHDLAEAEKHCNGCGKDLRLIAEETSEHYDYIPASVRVIQDVCLKYACDCTVRTANKPPQTDREKHGGGKSVSASDRGKVGRSSAAAPAGKDVRAAWHPDLAQNHGRVDGAMRETAGSLVPVDEEGCVGIQGDRHR